MSRASLSLYAILIFCCGLLTGIFVESRLAIAFRAEKTIQNVLVQRPASDQRKPVVPEHGANTLFRVFAPDVEVVMVGDSITADAYWNDIFPSVRIANRGIRGDTTRDVKNRLRDVLATNPERAFLMIGINDIRRGYSLDEITAAYEQIVEKLIDHQVEVHIQSTLQCSRRICGEKADQVIELNKWLQKYALERGVAFIDLNADMSNAQEGLKSSLTSDGYHLLGSGYRAWSEVIAPYLTQDNDV
jgi:lysophospholipase L1-like esterase